MKTNSLVCLVIFGLFQLTFLTHSAKSVTLSKDKSIAKRDQPGEQLADSPITEYFLKLGNCRNKENIARTEDLDKAMEYLMQNAKKLTEALIQNGLEIAIKYDTDPKKEPKGPSTTAGHSYPNYIYWVHSFHLDLSKAKVTQSDMSEVNLTGIPTWNTLDELIKKKMEKNDELSIRRKVHRDLQTEKSFKAPTEGGSDSPAEDDTKAAEAKEKEVQEKMAKRKAISDNFATEIDLCGEAFKTLDATSLFNRKLRQFVNIKQNLSGCVAIFTFAKNKGEKNWYIGHVACARDRSYLPEDKLAPHFTETELKLLKASHAKFTSGDVPDDDILDLPVYEPDSDN